MDWKKDLYLGKSVRRRYRMLQYKIANRMMHPVCYLIVMVCEPGRLLEIIPSACLLQNDYPSEQLKIIGMAGSPGEARGLSAQILSEVYESRGDFDVAAYFGGEGL